MGRRAAIVGAYETEQARRLPERRAIDLLIEAALGAIADAGFKPSDVDGVIGQWPGPGGAEVGAYSNRVPDASAEWVAQLGVTATFIDDTSYAGPVALQHAHAAIVAGDCETVLIVSGQAGVVPVPGQPVVAYTRPTSEFIGTWGATSPVEFSLLAQRHMHLFGTTPEQCAEVASAIRTSGNMNPNAVMHGRGPVSKSDVLSSREVCSPLRLLDLSLVSEGAAAMVVSARVKDSNQPVFIRALAAEVLGPPYINPPVYEELRSLGVRAAARAFARAQLDREDIDVFSLYDPTSFDVIRHFEVLGYCTEGEGGPFVSDGRLRLAGSHPTNLDGGCLSHAHLGYGQMTQKVKEAVDQLRGRAFGRQVPDAVNAVVTVGGGATRDYAVAILSTEAE